MSQSKKIQLRRLNGYSWSIIVAFIGAMFAMQYHTASFFLRDFFLILILIIIVIYWCEKSAYSIKQPECTLKKIALFNRDLLILSFSFLLACLVSLMFSLNNSDVKGWWPLIICFTTLYSLAFSFIFSIIALLIKNHRTYTMIFSFLIMVLMSLGSFLPHYTLLPLLGSVDIFFVGTSSLLIIHCLFAIGCRMVTWRI
ncbi:MAG: hypothetical protein Q8R24_07420 [Legionellaceae bacterium]|nr:hypothetical protein [Legionellaceae bacterium]